MGTSAENILADIDSTLDQLILNAQAIQSISHRPVFAEEVALLQKTQESLLARLLDMQALYANVQSPKVDAPKSTFSSLEKKLARFGKLNTKLIHKIEHRLKRKTRARRARCG